MTEEVTNENPRRPDPRTMGVISRAAFEVDDYWRIMEILHKRSLNFLEFDLNDTLISPELWLSILFFPSLLLQVQAVEI